MLGMKHHFDISGSIGIREVDIAGVDCNYEKNRKKRMENFLHGSRGRA